MATETVELQPIELTLLIRRVRPNYDAGLVEALRMCGRAVALGIDATADGDSWLAAGYEGAATARNSIALGHSTLASANRAIALGYGAAARVGYSANIGAAILVRKSEPLAPELSQWVSYYAGAEIYLQSHLLDLTVVTDYEVALPSNCRMWLNEVGVIITQVTGLVSQPTIRFGVAGSYAKQVPAIATVKLTAVGKRKRLIPNVPEDGETSLSFGVVLAANAGEFKGRAFWRGLLVENED